MEGRLFRSNGSVLPGRADGKGKPANRFVSVASSSSIPCLQSKHPTDRNSIGSVYLVIYIDYQNKSRIRFDRAQDIPTHTHSWVPVIIPDSHLVDDPSIHPLPSTDIVTPSFNASVLPTHPSAHPHLPRNSRPHSTA